MKLIKLLSLGIVATGVLALFQNCGSGYKGVGTVSASSDSGHDSSSGLGLTPPDSSSTGTSNNDPQVSGSGGQVTPPAAAPYVLQNKWTSVAWDPNATPYRRMGTAVWTGTRMIVWGGQNTTAMFTTAGASYDPVTGQWQAISATGAPSPRILSAAVWTGSKMIVWGGLGGANAANAVIEMGDGAIYDPATDTWSPMSAVGAPSARHGHSLVWTGSKVIVWGGSGPGGSGGLNTGAVYDPQTNTWAAFPQMNAPGPRTGHAAAWVANKMIIWGGNLMTGNVATTQLADGAAYDPTTGVWKTISATGAPTARSYSGNCSTGTKLILFGGYHNTGAASPYYGDGGIYDPATDAWTAVSATNAPIGRAYNGLVWTGKGALLAFGDSLSPSIFTPANAMAFLQ